MGLGAKFPGQISTDSLVSIVRLLAYFTLLTTVIAAV